MSIEAMKLAAEFNRYFTSGNGVDVPAKVSVSRDEWRALLTAIQQAEVTDDVVRDAERYRYLRDIRRRDSIVLSGPEAGVWCDAEDEDGTLLLLTEDDLDAAIDADMLAAKERANGKIN